MAHRYFLPDLPPPGEFVLGGALAHHLGRVVRTRPGERITLGDGRGASAAAVVLAVGRDQLRVEVGAHRHEAAPAPRLVLAFAVPRAARAEWLLEHATEVGVAAFQPIASARSRPDPPRAGRWQRIVAAAAGQCDRAHWPEVLPARQLADLLADPQLPARRWCAERGAPPLAADAGGDAAVLLVGPEGGFTAAERAAVTAAGFAPRGLGPHNLRTETAALVGAAILMARPCSGGERDPTRPGL